MNATSAKGWVWCLALTLLAASEPLSAASPGTRLTRNKRDASRLRIAEAPSPLEEAALQAVWPEAYLVKPANVVFVAKSGGDFSTISEALGSVEGTKSDKVVILICPGVYTETVSCDPYEYLVGLGGGVPQELEKEVIIRPPDGAEGIQIDTSVNWMLIRNLGIETRNAPAIQAAVWIVTDDASYDQVTRWFPVTIQDWQSAQSV